jgi:hypothetical protein
MWKKSTSLVPGHQKKSVSGSRFELGSWNELEEVEQKKAALDEVFRVNWQYLLEHG